MTPLIFIRPQPGCDSSVEAARARGLDAQGFPLYEVRPLAWEVPAADSFDAVLVGSANAMRHGGAGLAALVECPAYAVGEKTADACREAGLDVIVTGQGGLQGVLSRLEPAHRRLLRLAGAARVPLDPPTGVNIIERLVYASDALPMPDALAGKLRQRAVVALHSAEAARHFREQCEARGVELARHSLATIGPRVAEAAGSGWRQVRAADTPSEAALLALAEEMCKEGDEPQLVGDVARGTTPAPMQEESAAPANTALPPLPPARRSARGQFLVALLAFLLGALAVGWLVWRGYLGDIVPNQDSAALADAAPAPEASGDTAISGDALQEREAIGEVEGRLAMLEDRLSRLDLQANAASGNAARAESLLITFAARRMIDRGQPLRYLADQLQLRFADAQPRAVRTVIQFAAKPVTMDELAARLEALSPDLTGSSPDESFWDRAMDDLSNLFTVRREPTEVIGPQAAIERARVMLRAGKIDEAVAQVRRLPGADAGSKWIADAQRYAEVQRALDLLETTAMLEPNRLQDSEGNRVRQPSPLATPTATPTAAPTAAPAAARPR